VFFSTPEKNSITPEGIFTGSFKVENVKISPATPIEELRKKLKDYQESDSYIQHSYRFHNNGIYIFFQFNEDESQL